MRAAPRRLKAKGEIADPYRGFYVIVPPEYRRLGSLPADHAWARAMATLKLRDNELVVELSALEKIGAFSGNVRVPLSSVKEVRLTSKPYRELRGIRVGTGVPFVIVLGRMVYRGGNDFVAVYGTGQTVIVDLDGTQNFRRLFVSGVDASTVDEIRSAAHLA